MVPAPLVGYETLLVQHKIFNYLNMDLRTSLTIKARYDTPSRSAL